MKKSWIVILISAIIVGAGLLTLLANFIFNIGGWIVEPTLYVIIAGCLLFCLSILFD